MRYFTWLLVCQTVLCGCTSYRTTIMGRAENDSLYRETGGKLCKAGVPVKLKVPSHVAVQVYDQQLLVQTTGGVRLHAFTTPQIQIETNLEYTDKVFLVDFKRPAAGTLNLGQYGADGKGGVAFSEDQYFTAIKAVVEERTLRDITTVIEKFPKVPIAASSGVASNADLTATGVTIQKSLIAFERFDIADPDWELRMNCFIDEQLARATCMSNDPCIPRQAQVEMVPAQMPEEQRANLLPVGSQRVEY